MEGAQGSINWLFGLYRGVWRFASVQDLMRIAKAVLSGSALTLFVLFVLNRMEGVPRSVPVLYALLQMLLLAGPRLLYRWIKENKPHLIGRVAFVTGDTLGRDVEGFLKEVSAPYIEKPFLPEEVMDLVAQVMRGARLGRV